MSISTHSRKIQDTDFGNAERYNDQFDKREIQNKEM